MWVKLDDRFPEHPKVDSLSDAAFRLHVTAMCFAGRNETDGHLTDRRARTLAMGDASLIAELHKAKLWDKAADGWLIHDFLEYNPNRAQLEADRNRNRDRQRDWRQRNAVSNAVTDTVSVSAPSPSPSPYQKPDKDRESSNPVRHTQPSQTEGTNAQTHQCFPQGLPETRPGQRMDFDRFIHQYPRPNGKQRAWEAWRELDPDIHAVVLALTWQRKSPSWASDVQHWPNPETYIRDQRWTDEPPMEVEANKPPDKIKDTFQNLMRKGVIPNGQVNTDSRSSLSSGKRLPSKRDN